MPDDPRLLAATHAIHDVDCDEGPECYEVLTTEGRYGRWAAAALAAADAVDPVRIALLAEHPEEG